MTWYNFSLQHSWHVVAQPLCSEVLTLQTEQISWKRSTPAYSLCFQLGLSRQIYLHACLIRWNSRCSVYVWVRKSHINFLITAPSFAIDKRKVVWNPYPETDYNPEQWLDSKYYGTFTRTSTLYGRPTKEIYDSSVWCVVSHEAL